METTTKAREINDERIAPHKRLWWELRPSFGFFELKEPNGRTLDLASCLSAAGSSSSLTRWYTRPLKLLLLVWSLQVFALDIYHYPPHNLYIYMGYLTHWGHCLSICYLAFSFFGSALPLPTAASKITWALYSLTAPLELAIVLLFWSAVAAGPSAFSYTSVMEHGGVALLVWFDGTVLSTVPVRAKQVIGLMTVCFAYLFWTGVDAVLGIGNGDWGPAYEDDALYPVLNWNSDRETAVTASAVAICVVAPLCFYC